MPSEPEFPSLHLIGAGDLGKRWGWILGLGIVLVLLGTVATASARYLTLATMVFLGGLLFVAGNHDLAVCGRITTRRFSSAAARAVAWTREQLSADDLDFLDSLPLKANIGNRVIAVHGALHPETDCASVPRQRQAADAKF